MGLKSVREADLFGKRVLIRFDGDVPVRKMEDGKWKIEDTNRLEASLPTIRYCLKEGAKVVLVCHMGRPESQRIKKHELRIKDSGSDLSTHLLIPFFERELGVNVNFFDNFRTDPKVKVSLMENVRFWSGEETSDPTFVKQLARLGDLYVDDAMAVLHRDHASITGVPKIVKQHYLGLHVAEELHELEGLRANVHRPYTVILGGAKASDKSPIIVDLADKVDYLLLGGLVAVPYLKAMGYRVGAHQVEVEDLALARRCIRKLHEHNVNLAVPNDIVTAKGEVKAVKEWSPDDVMLDIGPKTRAEFNTIIKKSNTLFWNGAMGKFEDAGFAAGTLSLARSMVHADADTRVASGGDTVSAIHQFKQEKGFTFISTGGGATLEYIAGRELPGLSALK